MAVMELNGGWVKALWCSEVVIGESVPVQRIRWMVGKKGILAMMRWQ